MSDVFISYSRRDIAFARLIREALQQSEIDTWIDWERIPVGERWWQEICEAIENANVFMFIISKHSIGSEVCRDEIDLALKNHKRIIPILVDELSAEDIQAFVPELPQYNWIIFQRDQIFTLEEMPGAEADQVEDSLVALPKRPQFEEALAKLNTAIHTDWEWVKAHTRLQMRALEWERAGHDNSFLMQGIDLHQAENWLTAAIDKQPEPTLLQTRFIQSSRQEATKRQRWLLVAVGAALVVTIVLGVIAVFNAQRAIQSAHSLSTQVVIAQKAEETAQAESTRAISAEGIAQAERRTAQAESTRAISAESTAIVEAAVARSRQLAAYAVGQIDVNQERALLLAIESARTANTGEAQAALRQTLVHRGRTLRLLIGHTAPVVHVAWDLEGTRVVSASSDGTARIWDVESGEELSVLSGHNGAVIHTAWDSSGMHILTAGDDGTVRLWDAVSGKEKVVLSGHSGAVVHAEWNSDETWILIASYDGTARVWDTSTKQELLVVSGHSKALTHAAWDPEGTRLLTLDNETTVQLWDAASGEQLAVIPGGGGFSSILNYAAWSPDGTRLIITSNDKAEVWDVSTALEPDTRGAEPIHITTHLHASPEVLIPEIPLLLHAAWSADGTRILTVSSNGTAEIWDADNGQTIARLTGHTDTINHGAWKNVMELEITRSHILLGDYMNDDWDPVGPRVVTASRDGTARVWDAVNGVEFARLTGHEGVVNHAAWSPDGAYIATASADCTLRVWTVEAIDQLVELQSGFQERAKWSPNGKYILTDTAITQIWDAESGLELVTLTGVKAEWTTDGSRVLTIADDLKVQVWDISTALTTGDGGAPLVVFSGHSDKILQASWSPDSTMIATTSNDGTARVWEAESGDELIVLSGHTGAVEFAAWNAVGTRLLTQGKDGTVLVWDPLRGENVSELLGHEGRVRHAAWNPDGARIVTASVDGTARVWDADSGKEEVVLSASEGWMSYAAWSSDGARIVTIGREVQVWDSVSGRQLTLLPARRIDFVAWNPDSTCLATASKDMTVGLWDAANGKKLASIGGFFDLVQHVAWHPDGSRLVVSSWGEQPRVFDVPLVYMFDQACARAVRNMSELEWQQLMGDIPYQETCPSKPVPGRDYVSEGIAQ